MKKKTPQPPIMGEPDLKRHTRREQIRRDVEITIVNKYVCPICGYDSLREPLGPDRDHWGSQEICPSCGWQFGYNNPDSLFRYRAQWVETSAKWLLPEKQPQDWGLSGQLANIGMTVRDVLPPVENPLLKIESVHTAEYTVDDGLLNLQAYGAWIEAIPDRELEYAVIAANVNVLRREAPYAYFFVTNTTLEKWHSSGLLRVQPYLQSFAVIQLNRGVWLNAPNLDFEAATVAVAVLLGDILPLARMIGDGDNCLLCLKAPMTLEQIDVTIAEAETIAEGVQTLVGSQGFLLSLTDSHHLEVRTLNKDMLKYFTLQA